MIAPNPHARIDEENRERDRRIAAILRRKPEMVQLARDNLRRWLDLDGGTRDPALLEWQDILDFVGLDELARFLESRSPKADRLRQSSPFVGLDTPREASG